ncbi:Transcription initiation factor TFIID subunit 2 [Phytophthora pseudosyringae]|uniref:Transcription initiation factor TFIID subunit 2 n=1 Tax=Phytophthora pseudosyringae TaxID=221518 RepID=A0A8T1W6F7_9STRA|nr:Transcription initiation factor TFIID subunit 2 [Phytophthora pseudosyringae]
MSATRQRLQQAIQRKKQYQATTMRTKREAAGINPRELDVAVSIANPHGQLFAVNDNPKIKDFVSSRHFRRSAEDRAPAWGVQGTDLEWSKVVLNPNVQTQDTRFSQWNRDAAAQGILPQVIISVKDDVSCRVERPRELDVKEVAAAVLQPTPQPAVDATRLTRPGDKPELASQQQELAEKQNKIANLQSKVHEVRGELDNERATSEELRVANTEHEKKHSIQEAAVRRMQHLYRRSMDVALRGMLEQYRAKLLAAVKENEADNDTAELIQRVKASGPSHFDLWVLMAARLVHTHRTSSRLGFRPDCEVWPPNVVRLLEAGNYSSAERRS